MIENHPLFRIVVLVAVFSRVYVQYHPPHHLFAARKGSVSPGGIPRDGVKCVGQLVSDIHSTRFNVLSPDVLAVAVAVAVSLKHRPSRGNFTSLCIFLKTTPLGGRFTGKMAVLCGCYRVSIGVFTTVLRTAEINIATFCKQRQKSAVKSPITSEIAKTGMKVHIIYNMNVKVLFFALGILRAQVLTSSQPHQDRWTFVWS